MKHIKVHTQAALLSLLMAVASFFNDDILAGAALICGIIMMGVSLICFQMEKILEAIKQRELMPQEEEFKAALHVQTE